MTIKHSTSRIIIKLKQIRKVGDIPTVISLEGNSASGEHKSGDRLGEAVRNKTR